jgi:hypothetical protein
LLCAYFAWNLFFCLDCPWIGGCVGYNNYCYFYNFLFWLEIGCFYLVLVTFPLISYPTDQQFMAMYKRAQGEIHPPSHESYIFCILVLTASAGIAVGALLSLHSYLIITNQTTIELYSNGKKRKQAKRRGDSPFLNPYDLNTIGNNIRSMIGGGKYIFYSFFPGIAGCGRMQGNGLNFALNPNCGGSSSGIVEYYRNSLKDEDIHMV